MPRSSNKAGKRSLTPSTSRKKARRRRPRSGGDGASSGRGAPTRPASPRPSGGGSGGNASPGRTGRSYEAEILPGLAAFAREELAAIEGVRLGADGDPAGDAATATTSGSASDASRDRLPFRYAGEGDPPIDGLRTVTSLQRVLSFDVPRPKSLLGDHAFARIVDEVQDVVRTHGPFEGLRCEAAGSDSDVFLRFRRRLAQALDTPDDPDDGELRLRVRPDPDADRAEGSRAWQVLIRTSPRPLSARSWRVRNLTGGLNACVAAGVWRWLGTTPDQRVLNAMCGSGTLLIERAALGPVARLVGIDLDVDALEAAADNATAAGLEVRSDLPRPTVRVAERDGSVGSRLEETPSQRIELQLGDATGPVATTAATPAPRPGERPGERPGTPTATEGIEPSIADPEAPAFDVFVADPPWGDALGEMAALPELYARLLAEAARRVVPGGRAVVVTHALRVFEQARSDAADLWEPDGVLRVFHGGHRPALYRLKRRT